MDDLVTDDLGGRIRALALREAPPRDPVAVARRVMHGRGSDTRHRPFGRLPLRRLALLGSLALLLLVSIAAGLLATTGSQLLDATVEGRSYTVAVARSFDIDPTRLTEHSEAEVASALGFESLTAYRIDGVDPATVLVLRLTPGQQDDAGDLGEYALLVRGADAFASVCQYFDPKSDATPRACRPAQP